MERTRLNRLPERWRQSAGDLARYFLGGRGQFLVAGALDEGEAEDNGFGFLDGEHQRRQVEAGAQYVADAALAIDRHAHRLKRCDVAIDRALGDLEAAGNGRRG